MRDINVYKINDDASPRVHRYDMLREHELTRLTGEQEQVMVEQLSKPVKCRCVLTVHCFVAFHRLNKLVDQSGY